MHRFSAIKILIVYSREIEQNIHTAVYYISKLINDLIRAHNATYDIEILEINKSYEDINVPHIKGALRFLTLLEKLPSAVQAQLGALLLLPYTPDIISQWTLGSTATGLTRIAKLLNNCNSRVCMITPLTYTSLDYTALVYQLLEPDELSKLTSCAIVERELLSIQYKSPEYIYGPVKLLKTLAHRLSEIE